MEDVKKAADGLDWDKYNESMQSLFNKLDTDQDGFLEDEEALDFIGQALKGMADHLGHPYACKLFSLYRSFYPVTQQVRADDEDAVQDKRLQVGTDAIFPFP